MTPDEVRRILDMEIDHLATENLELRARVADQETDAAVYRELLCASFDALRHLTVKHDRVLDDRDRLREECRRLREDVFAHDDSRHPGSDDHGIAA